MTLGELIEKLEAYITLDGKKKSERILIDFAGLMPTGLSSYRGYYHQLAIEYDEATWADRKDMRIAKFLKLCKEAVGKEFTGWKGGEFTMSKDTPLWVANSGNTGSTIVTGVIVVWSGLMIETAYKE